MSLFEKVFGTHSDKELKKIYPIVDKIEALDSTMQALSDEELKAKTPEFKERLEKGETLDDLLPEAFAVVREAADRVLHMKHYRVQLIGGILLHQGRIPEMRTGEGKTLVSTLPAYLNALEGKGVHIVTVNDYLAKRDAEWMGQVHEFLGLTVGVILNSDKNDARRAAYNCDITYVTNNELGFDYLRDNMVIYKEQLVQRDLHYAIVDEVDSVLIDEARTPLIISGQSGKSTDLYKMCDYLARRMKRGTASMEISKLDAIMGTEIEEDGDYLVDEKDKQVVLTAQGVKEVEQFFHIDNFSDADNIDIQHNMIMALRAHALMFRDKDYVVKDDEVLIVDEFTGRIMPGRRFSDGLHQAIEAKENVKVKRESRTLATITFQNFFNKYKKKAGMTGTALTEEEEFREIYGMDVVVVPTNLPVQRIDHHDSIFKTKKEKLNAIVQAVVEAHDKGQPVLVGTITIDASEELSRMLTKRGIQHKVLNAKFHELEAEIVADAGQRGAVTIATNMAGRGTDIMLGGNAEYMAKAQMRKEHFCENLLSPETPQDADPAAVELLLTDDPARAESLAQDMSKLNELRKEMTDRGVRAATDWVRKDIRMIPTEDGVKEKKIGDDKVIVLYMPGIHESIAGLIASKLKEAFYRPTLVFTDAENGHGLKGSGRSIETYNMFDKLCEHKELFVKVGGHPMAAGFTITREALEPLREALNRDCNLTDADLVEKLYVDESCAIKQLTLPLYEELAKLEPYGTANVRPLFGIVKMGIRSIKMVGNEGQYARCTFVDGNGTRINGMVFRGKELLDNIKVWFGDKECDKILKGLQNHALIDILYHMKKNEFNGTVSIQMEPVSIRKSVYYETSK